MAKQLASRIDPSPTWELYTAHNSTNFTRMSRAIYVGTGGNVALVDADDNVVIWPNVPSGYVIDAVAKRINSTSTSASGFVIMY